MKGNFKEIDFVKMHGAGNDYVYIDCFAEPGFEVSPEGLGALAEAISDRHFGVGGDGLVLMMRSDVADARMRMFNADGSEAQMCGNASRCVGKYLYDSGLIDRTEFTLETAAGIRHLTLHPGSDGAVESVTVDMGLPELRAAAVPARCGEEVMKEHEVRLADGRCYRVTAVGMGNPHGVIFTDRITDAMVLGDGPELERHEVWPEKANIEFVEVIDRGHVRMRVWERGTGETLACGTGSCAVAVAGELCGLTDRRVEVELTGGRLIIDRDPATGHVLMTGPAAIVAKGTYRVPAETASLLFKQ